VQINTPHRHIYLSEISELYKAAQRTSASWPRGTNGAVPGSPLPPGPPGSMPPGGNPTGMAPPGMGGGMPPMPGAGAPGAGDPNQPPQTPPVTAKTQDVWSLLDSVFGDKSSKQNKHDDTNSSHG
jgi:hypothetical protein